MIQVMLSFFLGGLLKQIRVIKNAKCIKAGKKIGMMHVEAHISTLLLLNYVDPLDSTCNSSRDTKT